MSGAVRPFAMRALLAAVAIVVTTFVVGPAARATEVGARATDFNLPDASGKKVKLSALKGKVVVVDFWASWCKPCKKSLPALQGLAQKYDGKDVIVLAVNIDKKRSSADQFLQVAKITRLLTLYDPSGTVASQWSPPTMPSSYVVDKRGVVRYVHAGYTPGDERKLTDEIEKNLR